MCEIIYEVQATHNHTDNKFMSETSHNTNFKQNKTMSNYYCEYCGLKFQSVYALTSANCGRHPNGQGKHKLYEGSEKSTYICKYCGLKFSSIYSMTSILCQRHPNGQGKGKHSPAL